MKTKEDINQRIQELKNKRDAYAVTQSTRTRYNNLIRELEWVLDEGD